MILSEDCVRPIFIFLIIFYLVAEFQILYGARNNVIQPTYIYPMDNYETNENDFLYIFNGYDLSARKERSNYYERKKSLHGILKYRTMKSKLPEKK